MKTAVISEEASFQYLHTPEAFLKNINLKIKKGECILICGASGSGKSTFSRLINGISPNYIEGTFSGELQTLDLQAGVAEIEEYVPHVGSVFQNPKTQHFTMDTTSELAFPLENAGVDPEIIKEKVFNKANLFGVQHLLDRNIFELSGGEKQQIAFVSANMLEPEILVLDEVTSNLDDGAIERIRKMVNYLKEKGTTIIIFEHRLAWTKDIVDRYIMFEAGKVVREWEAKEFNQLSNKELHTLGLRSMDLMNDQEIIQKKKQKEQATKIGQLQTKNLSVGYSNQEILKDLNLDFQVGEVVGLMGANGTGKSTLANTLTGLEKPLRGEILWNGKAISQRAMLKKSYLVMQDMNYQLFTESVIEEVLLGAKNKKNSAKILEQLNLTSYKERHPHSLSEGQKQRVAIASALVSGNELIVFDEPTSGLDYQHMERFGQLLEDLKQTDTIIIVITHDMELAAKWCDKIITLD